MSEKEKEEEEENIIDYWGHEHPLTPVETRSEDECYVCERYFRSGEQGYGCGKTKCGYKRVLHEECARLPRKITHTLHSQHILSQEFCHDKYYTWCSICWGNVKKFWYECTSPRCMFGIDIRCAMSSGVIDAVDDDDKQKLIINHPSHPKHELKLLKRWCPFKCDACGTTRRGNSYVCTSDCQYWIHEECALLPETMTREDHHHFLSLSFHVPHEYVKFGCKCKVCKKLIHSTNVRSTNWVYQCERCRYVVHLKCAFKKSPPATRDDKGIMKFPIINVGEDQIGAFVKRQGIASPIPDHDVDYKFHNHKLKAVSSSSSSSQEEKEEENSDDDGEDDYIKKSKLICDGCITPIRKHRPSSSSPSSSSSSKNDYYMSCSSSGCNFNLHMSCFHLPPHLPSLPLHNQSGHQLDLRYPDKLQPWKSQHCSVCYYPTNGLLYACTKCYFKVDIKCASMPDTIYHAAHPQHPLNLLSAEDTLRRRYQLCEAGCGTSTTYCDCYACGSCDFIVHVGCAGLPESTASRKWDKHHHPLPLTYDATLNRPGDFYCDKCEREMNPESWMYHCRSCDLSFHPRCLKTRTGYDKNIKFGQKYEIAGVHSHTLTYQLLTTKRHCNACGKKRYEKRGFHCASCNYFICFYNCVEKFLKNGGLKDGRIKAVD